MADTPTSNLAPMYGPYVDSYLSNAQALSNTPYQPYTGERYAPTTDLQNQAYTGIAQLSMPTQYGEANKAFNTAVNQATAGNNYTPTTFNAPGYTASQVATPNNIGYGLDASNAATVNSFMNPYQQGVTDIAIREAQRRYASALPGMNAAAARAGAFGGSRHGVMEAEAYRNLNTSLNDMQMQGSAAAFNAAQQAINNQRQANYNVDFANQGAGMRTNEFNANALNNAGQFNAGQNLTAQQYTDQSKQFGASNYNQGIQNLIGAGNALTNSGVNQFNTQTGINNAQLNAGNLQQANNQKPLDFGYEQWTESLKYPYEQLNFQKNMLQGLPLSVNQTPGTNPLLEGLMAAGGLYQLLNQP
jgi:hypothetical protein